MDILLSIVVGLVGIILVTASLQVVGIKLIDYYFERKVMYNSYGKEDKSNLN